MRRPRRVARRRKVTPQAVGGSASDDASERVAVELRAELRRIPAAATPAAMSRPLRVLKKPAGLPARVALHASGGADDVVVAVVPTPPRPAMLASDPIERALGAARGAARWRELRKTLNDSAAAHPIRNFTVVSSHELPTR